MIGRVWNWMLVAGFVSLVVACSNQGEGERCSRNAGNDGKDDCEPGLSCQLVNNLELCCPYDRPASDPQCIASVAVKDAGTSDSAAADAADEPAVEDDAEADADLGGD